MTWIPAFWETLTDEFIAAGRSLFRENHYFLLNVVVALIPILKRDLHWEAKSCHCHWGGKGEASSSYMVKKGLDQYQRCKKTCRVRQRYLVSANCFNNDDGQYLEEIALHSKYRDWLSKLVLKCKTVQIHFKIFLLVRSWKLATVYVKVVQSCLSLRIRATIPFNSNGTWTSAIMGGVISWEFLYPPWSATTAMIVSSSIEFPEPETKQKVEDLYSQKCNGLTRMTGWQFTHSIKRT